MHNRTFHYAAMSMMTSQILKSVDFIKKKSRYLENKRVFLQIKKIHSLHIKSHFFAKTSSVAEVTFKLEVNIFLGNNPA